MPRNRPLTSYRITRSDGEYFDISEMTDAFYIGDDNLGMPPLHRLSQRGVFQHGDTDVDFRLDPREIVMSFGIKGSCYEDYWNKRKRILSIFKPSLSPLTLESLDYSGNIRRISAKYVKGLELNSDDSEDMVGNEFYQKMAVVLKANDPIWYDPTLYSQTYASVAFTDLVFPISFPIEFGTRVMTSVSDLVYNGTWLSYPQIVLTGPIGYPIIVNNTTGEVIEMTYKIVAGQIVTMDLSYGQKTVFDSGGNNLNGVISATSDFSTFHLEPEPVAVDGINNIEITATELTPGVSNVVFNYYERYLGI